MPRKYKRKEGAIPHGAWSQAALIEGLKAMAEGKLSKNEIARRYGIPARTLQRRFKNNNALKITAGKHPALDFDNENQLAAEIQNLEEAGFSPTREMIRKIAFEFAEKLGLNVPFNKETRMAGVGWLASFLERHPEVKVQKRSSLSSLQETEMKRKIETITDNLKKHAETSQMPPNQPKEYSHDSNDDPLMIKIETFDEESDNAHIDNEVPLEESKVLVKMPTCTNNKDVVNQNGLSLDENRVEIRDEIVEAKCDGVDLLFLGYAAAVKKLSRRKQIIVKQEISRIIAEAELGDLD